MAAAPWTASAGTIARDDVGQALDGRLARPRLRRWQVAAGLWLIPAAALWLQALLWPESLRELAWLAASPTLLASVLLVMGSESLALLVVSFQRGSGGVSLLRFAPAPLAIALLPAALGLLGIGDVAIATGGPTPLTTAHLLTLGALLYGGFAALGLRGLLVPART